ncbi:methylmalonyl-CoA mutase subunit beta [Flagellimonas myxillae]|uniref:methylmalonyl-CoA mutase subunit beta n=1 Tax=Flagellimonas myxillae TaxID=2942214 RepID=UPI00201FA7FD|nr:methylmalonyl-CoA mutase subunit beta [Muricauda myxillae]MCL6265392.1 methylmalonyl-CoA mutase subunit beta [Muricauda myxillae]
MDSPNLFDEFPSVSSKQWKHKIQFDLKGADYNESLVWESLEGIKVKPFYHPDDLQNLKTFQLSRTQGWKIAQTIYAGDAKKANVRMHDLLQRGAESLILTIPQGDLDFSLLFQGIDIAKTPLHFNFKPIDGVTTKQLFEFLKSKGGSRFFHIDLIGNLARTGNWYQNLEKDHGLLEKIFSWSVEQEVGIVLGVDVSLYQNAGANMVQQLAYGLAHANEYLNLFSKQTTVAALKSTTLAFKVAVGGNYFFEIAKLRALRWLWKSIAPAYGLESDCHILALPSKRNKTLYDYNVNLLRTTSECMSAILGGADTLCNLPYDAIYHKDNKFADRIARNQAVLLKEESYFEHGDKVAEGNYYIESLTQQLAEKSLDLFKQIEQSGGFLGELKKGNIQRKIKESAAKEQLLFDEGEITLLGTNKYQNPMDRMKDEMELYPFTKTHPRKTILEPIIEKRLAEKVEQKRLDNE